MQAEPPIGLPFFEEAALAKLLPPCVAVAEYPGDAVRMDSIFPAEAALVGERTVRTRQGEFAAGRACAHCALRALGLPARPVLRGKHGEPLWPSGVVGSITHCSGYTAAAVAHDEDISALGIDAANDVPLSAEVASLVTTESEREWAQLHRDDAVHWETVIFSAKESLYKAWFPLARRWLGFHEAEVDVHPLTRALRARLVAADAARADVVAAMQGRFDVAGGHILTTFVLARTAPRERTCEIARRSSSLLRYETIAR
jgi:4'-phosphopantetheinyl transferase EntD